MAVRTRADLQEDRVTTVDICGPLSMTPQEDEFAPCLMSLRSPYFGVRFPKREDFYDRFLTFEGVAAEDVTACKDALLLFLRKLAYKTQKPLIL